jgi:hypothetical protein
MQQDEIIYPEYEKLMLIKNESQIIGEFLEWLTIEKELSLCAHDEGGVNEAYYSNEEILSEYFKIDLYKLEQEKNQMLKQLKEKN